MVWEDIRELKVKMLTTFLAAIMEVYNMSFAIKKDNQAKSTSGKALPVVEEAEAEKP